MGVSKSSGRGMRRILKWLAGIIFSIVFVAVLFVAHSLHAKPLHIRIFYERVFAQFGFESPQLLSTLRILPSWLDWYSDDLDDYSLAHGEKVSARLVNDYQTLQSYDRSKLDDPLSYDLLSYFMKQQVDGITFQYHNYPLNQLFGIQSSLPTFMATQHQVKSVGEGENYLSRLSQVPRAVEQTLEGLRKREEMKIIPPTFVVEKVLAEMQAFIATAPKENILYVSLKQKLDKAGESIAAGERERLLAATETAITEQVYPAYKLWIDYYTALQPKTTGNNGVWALPDGEALYRYAVQQHTTTDMTPDQVHALGLQEVARIETEMNDILIGEGLSEGTIGERVLQIAQRPDQLYPDTDEGRQQILADYQKMIDTIDAGLAPYFNVRPKQSVKVERIPEFKEKTSPGAYYQIPAFDGSRPGIFYANLRSVKEIPKFGMRTLAYHEAIPGHHFQKTIQQELTGVPTFRKLLPFTAFAEGWALYSERFAAENGFQPTPLDQLGRLQAEMFRAVRLVVDTGLHHKRWTREQAIDYMVEKTGMPQTDVVAEIERYLVMPGQALAYKVGMNTILELREQTKNQLGERFDIKAFHDLVLTGGDMPMSLLRDRVNAWIASKT